MDKEIDRMMMLRRFAIISAVLSVLFIALMIGMIIVMQTNDYNGKNSSFAVLKAKGEVQEMSVELDSFSELYFFSERYEKRKTLFREAAPLLKVVNSDEYKVEVKGNKELLDKLEMIVNDKRLSISLKKENYNSVYGMNKEYNGLYVDCTQLEITVYAPITYMHSSAQIGLDYACPKADSLIIIVDGEVRDGKIHGVDVNTFGLSVSGNSTITAQGSVSGIKELVAKHNSTINANELKGMTTYADASCQLFGISRINDVTDTYNSFSDVGFAATVAPIVMAVAFAAGFVVLWMLFLKQKREIDSMIEEMEKTENYLVI